jgi:hypothetical protein
VVPHRLRQARLSEMGDELYELHPHKAVEEVGRELREARLKPPTKVTTPLSLGDHLEINATAELDAEWQNYYQGIIGVVCWI